IKILPWLTIDPHIAIQQIYIPASGNGWQRGDHSTDSLLHLSKRTRLKIRLPYEYIDKLNELTGKEILVAGYPIKFGKIKITNIGTSEILVSRFVHIPDTENDEEQFLSIAYQQLKQKNVVIKKMLCGKSARFNFNNQVILTRSLMLADLSSEDSLLIQSTGVGENYLYGCGVFIPQKGIKAINKDDT
ncbi:MAG: type I-MYXAN CRISPR-associated protein Cas6/Cmx6, partial [Pseudomonadota bacterium]